MRHLLRRETGGDDGFTLVESVVALLIAGVIFSALAGSIMTAVKATLVGRQNQQAVDFMTRELERARTLDFGALGHASTVTSDPRLAACGGSAIDPDGAGPLGCEIVHVIAGPGVNPHIKTPSAAEANNTDFTTATYVTRVPGANVNDLRRVTVFATWTNNGQTKTRSTSSLVAFTQRGLPLPVFKLVSDPSAVSVNPGGTVVYKLSVTNQGAPDRWNISLSGAGATLPWLLVRDVDGDGAYDPAVDVDTAVLVDTTGDGVVDTDRIDPSESVTFFAVWRTTTSTGTGTTPTTVTAKSFGQPSAEGGAASVTVTTTVTNDSIAPTPTSTTSPGADDCAYTGSTVSATRPTTSHSVLQHVLHQDPSGAESNALPQLVMDTAAADETQLARWSLDVDGTALGRAVSATTPGVSDSTILGMTDARTFADWRRQFGASANVGGTAALRLWVAGMPSNGADLNLRAVVYAYLRSGNSYSLTPIGSVPVTLPASTCAGLQEVHVEVPLTTTTLAKNDYLGVRLVNHSGSLVRLAYDVPGAYDSRIEVATK